MYKKAKVNLWRFVLLTSVCASLLVLKGCCAPVKSQLHFYQAQDQRIRKVGRFYAGADAQPTVYAPGAYIEFTFSGARCEVVLQDERRYGQHNFIVYQIDQQAPVRILLDAAENTLVLKVAQANQKHRVRICKASEATMGFVRFVGLRCEKLLATKRPKLLFEFIGDSITCGNGSDASKLPFGEGPWHIYHNAYMSYGPLLSRELDADWQLSAVSGIGLASSCCGLRYQMPAVYNFIGFNTYKQPWQTRKQRQPNVIFITLGQNDRLRSAVDQQSYERAYFNFLQRLRNYYPKAIIICCNSPMATVQDKTLQNESIRRVVSKFRHGQDPNIHFFAYRGVYRGGNDKHPTLVQHRHMMHELLVFVKSRLRGALRCQ